MKPRTSVVHNLAARPVSSLALRCLSLGVGFVPDTEQSCMSRDHIKNALKDLRWRLNWQHIYRFREGDVPRFYVRKGFGDWIGRSFNNDS